AAEHDGFAQGVGVADDGENEGTSELATVDANASVGVDEVRLRDDAYDAVDLDRLRTGIAQLRDRVEQRRGTDGVLAVGDRDADSRAGHGDGTRQDSQSLRLTARRLLRGLGALARGLQPLVGLVQLGEIATDPLMRGVEGVEELDELATAVTGEVFVLSDGLDLYDRREPENDQQHRDDDLGATRARPQGTPQ